MTRALITGITGQDGSYLAEYLLTQNYEVAGLVRRTSTPNHDRIVGIVDQLTLLEGDLTDDHSIRMAVHTFQPDEIYHLGAQSYVGTSWRQPVATAEATGMSTLRLLNAAHELGDDVRFYQAGSSEQFGKVKETPQTETTPFHPRSPYGVAKCFAHYATVNYRESYGMHASCGILFNHESPRRGLEFVTRKVTRGVAEIYHGRSDCIRMGNLDARRDWGDARDFVRAMYLMLQEHNPDDYVISTGTTRSIAELLREAFLCIGITEWEDYVEHDPKLLRPAEVDLLLGDCSKARDKLGWEPTISFRDMIQDMVTNDITELATRAGDI